MAKRPSFDDEEELRSTEPPLMKPVYDEEEPSPPAPVAPEPTIQQRVEEKTPEQAADAAKVISANAADKPLVDKVADMEEFIDSSNLSPEASTAVKSEFEKIRDWYEGKQGDLEKREMFERMSHALAQLAASVYGMKHGVDLSGIKFDKIDWDRRQKAIDTTLRARLDDLSTQEERAFKKSERIATQKHQTELETAKAAARQEVAQGKSDAGRRQKVQQLQTKVGGEVRKIALNPKIDDDQKAAEIKQLVSENASGLGLTPEQIEQELTQPASGVWTWIKSMFSDAPPERTNKDVESMRQSMVNLFNKDAEAPAPQGTQEAPAPKAEEMFTIRDTTGRTKQIPMSEARKRGLVK